MSATVPPQRQARQPGQQREMQPSRKPAWSATEVCRNWRRKWR
jgi:hypothetical protein